MEIKTTEQAAEFAIVGIRAAQNHLAQIKAALEKNDSMEAGRNFYCLEITFDGILGEIATFFEREMGIKKGNGFTALGEKLQEKT